MFASTGSAPTESAGSKDLYPAWPYTGRMQTGVVILNFGEPARPDRDVVIEYLTRIFYNNAALERADTDAEARERSRELARRRAPGLLEEYEEIGGSPLNEQANAQQAALEAELEARGHDVEVFHGMQFMEPLIPDVASELAAEGIDEVVGLPIYPLCGHSTNVAALNDLEDAIDEIDGYDPDVAGITGWHRSPTYNRIRAEAIAGFLEENGLDPTDPDTAFVFSAHGTPTHYLEDGNRYDVYVDEHAETVARMAGIDDYRLGFQNHSNRDVPWTEPEVEDVIDGLEGDAERVVVEPMSFIHEQSETLVELDVDLRADAEAVGLEFHRVPVPHDDPRLGTLFADLLEPFLAGFDPAYYQFRQCQCRDEPGTYCLNAPLDD